MTANRFKGLRTEAFVRAVVPTSALGYTRLIIFYPMESKDLRSALVATALVLSLGLVAATGVAATAFFKAKTLGNVIEVTGSADRTITSDVVKWSGRISRTVGVDGLKGGSAAIKADLATVTEALHAAGVKDEQLTIRPVNVFPNYAGDANGTSHMTGYSIDQGFLVESNDVKGITVLSHDVADKMLASGVVFSTDGLEYYYSKLAELKLQMLSDATANAKARAQRIAESTGARLGTVRSAGMGVFQVTAVNSAEISDYGAYDTGAIEKKVTAVARTTFQIN